MYLATLYLPDLNPIGPPSVFAACLALAFALLTSRLLRIHVRIRGILTASAPLVFLFLSATTEGSVIYFLAGGPRRCFPDADDRVAEIIYYVFGFVFAINCFRFLRVPYRIVGWLFTTIYGSAITLLAAGLLTSMRFMSSWQSWRLYLVFGTVPVFICVWAPIAMILDRHARMQFRRANGCCGTCGYDLTGNVSGVCPECGAEA